MKSGFKRTINWNKYQSKATIQNRNQYLVDLIDPSFQGVDKLFVLSFENNAIPTIYTRCFFPSAEIKDYNIMIDGKNFFDKLVKNDMGTYENIWMITTGQGNYYTTGCILDYRYLKKVIS